MLWTSDEVSVLDRIIFLEDLKMVMEAMTTCLDNKELVVMTMKNYDGVSFGQIQEYFKANRDERLSDYMVKKLEEIAMKKIRRDLKFKSWGY